MALPTYNLEFIRAVSVAKNTLQLDFRPEHTDFSFTAGQFISLRFEYEGEQYKRSYSLACSPDSFKKNGLLEIAIGLIPDGKASQCFSHATPGTQFVMAGPAGVLVMPEELPESLVLVGTGTGIAPYRSMLPELEAALLQGVHVRVIMGVRRREDLFYDEDFRQLAAKYTNAQYNICFSREEKVNESSGEYRGYVQHHFESLNLTPGKDLVYLCGNPAMIDDSLAWLKNSGFNNKQLRREKYTFSR